jgi:hypothetical protein
MKVIEIRTEERTGLFEGTHTPLDQKFRKYRIDSQFRRKLSDVLYISTFTYFPYLCMLC